MEVLKNSHNGYATMTLKDNGKTFKIDFAGNLDLYWSMINENNHNDFSYDNFLITKENYQIYKVFDKLYKDIANCQIFKKSEDVYNSFDLNESLRESDEYKELFDGKHITWISDDRYLSYLNIVRISKDNDNYLIEFAKEEQKDTSYLSCDNAHIASVCFRNSGSSYDPFNIAFMKMYKSLCEYDPEYHQTHIEEYLYSKK